MAANTENNTKICHMAEQYTPESTVYGVFEPHDEIMGDPTGADELYSLWRTEGQATVEAQRLSLVNGYQFIVKPLTVNGDGG